MPPLDLCPQTPVAWRIHEFEPWYAPYRQYSILHCMWTCALVFISMLLTNFRASQLAAKQSSTQTLTAVWLLTLYYYTYYTYIFIVLHVCAMLKWINTNRLIEDNNIIMLKCRSYLDWKPHVQWSLTSVCALKWLDPFQPYSGC